MDCNTLKTSRTSTIKKNSHVLYNIIPPKDPTNYKDINKSNGKKSLPMELPDYLSVWPQILGLYTPIWNLITFQEWVQNDKVLRRKCKTKKKNAYIWPCTPWNSLMCDTPVVIFHRHVDTMSMNISMMFYKNPMCSSLIGLILLEFLWNIWLPLGTNGLQHTQNFQNKYY